MRNRLRRRRCDLVPFCCVSLQHGGLDQDRNQGKAAVAVKRRRLQFSCGSEAVGKGKGERGAAGYGTATSGRQPQSERTGQSAAEFVSPRERA